MKSKVNKVIAIILVVLVFLVGCFCYFNPKNIGIEELESSKDEVLYFWYTDKEMASYYNNAAGAYNLENNYATIIPRLVSGSEYLENIYNISTTGGDVPDLYVISNDSLEKAYLAGLTTPLEEDNESLAEFSQVAIDAVTYKDNILGYPYYFETSTLVYNKTYLDEIAYQLMMTPDAGTEEEEEIEIVSFMALSEEEQKSLQDQVDQKGQEILPKNITELFSLANRIIAPTGMEHLFKWDINDIFFNYFYVGEYMEVGGPAGDDSDKLNIYNENTVTCLETFQELAQFFYMDPEEVSSESITEEFIDGKVLFSIVDTHSAAAIEKAKKDEKLSFEYGYSLIPNLTDELKGRSLSVTSAVVINGYSEHSELADDFARFLTCEYTESLYDKTGQLTANSTNITDSDMEGMFRAEYVKSIPMPKMMATSNFWMYLENVFSAVWQGADIRTELEMLQNKMNEQIIQ